MTDEKEDLLMGLKVSQKNVDGKERIVLEDGCSYHYMNDEGVIKSEFKEGSPCKGILEVAQKREHFIKNSGARMKKGDEDDSVTNDDD